MYPTTPHRFQIHAFQIICIRANQQLRTGFLDFQVFVRVGLVVVTRAWEGVLGMVVQVARQGVVGMEMQRVAVGAVQEAVMEEAVAVDVEAEIRWFEFTQRNHGLDQSAVNKYE
jgi:hypothetical protein